MSKKSKEIEIESIETPKGNIPTIKGLETVLNTFLESQVHPLAETIKGINKEIKTIRTSFENTNSFIQQIGDKFGELLVLVAKIKASMDEGLSLAKNNRIDGIEDQQRTLIELQTILAKLLVQFQTLPILHGPNEKEKK